jgi:hypothetical protein
MPARHTVIACDKREAFAQGSEATKQSMLPRSLMDGLLRFARNDGVRATPALPKSWPDAQSSPPPFHILVADPFQLNAGWPSPRHQIA